MYIYLCRRIHQISESQASRQHLDNAGIHRTPEFMRLLDSMNVKFQGTAIRAAINALTAEQATGYFRDCGLVPDDFAAANVNESAEERRSRLLLLLLLFLG